MAFVIQLSNLVKKRGETDGLNQTATEEYLDEEWLEFVEGELE